MITTNKLIVIGGLSTENLHVSFPSYFYKGVYCEKKAHDKKNKMVEQHMVLRAEFFRKFWQFEKENYEVSKSAN